MTTALLLRLLALAVVHQEHLVLVRKQVAACCGRSLTVVTVPHLSDVTYGEAAVTGRPRKSECSVTDLSKATHTDTTQTAADDVRPVRPKRPNGLTHLSNPSPRHPRHPGWSPQACPRAEFRFFSPKFRCVIALRSHPNFAENASKFVMRRRA